MLQRTFRGHLGRLLFADARRQLPGLHWVEINAKTFGPTFRDTIRTLVKSATEIKNEGLATALLDERLNFCKVELDAFGAASLSYDCFIKIDGKYFKPAEAPRLTWPDFARVLERRLEEKAMFLRRQEIQRQTELLLHADAHCCADIFQSLQESVSVQRLAQLKALLNGIKIGTVMGFSFLTVSEDIRVPIKALNRWVRGDTIIKNKKENESTAQLEERIEKMMRVIRDKVLAWFERTPRVQGELGAWKDDVQLPIVMAADGHESRGDRLARYLICC